MSTKVVGLCYKRPKSKEKPHKVHIQTIDPSFFRAWEKSTKEIDCFNGWTKKELRLEGVKLIVLGMIHPDGLNIKQDRTITPDGGEYLDMWAGLKSSFAKRILETELSRGKKITLRPGVCPECFEKYLEKNHIRERGI